MNFQLHIDIPPLAKPIDYQDKIYLIGSCFTEHMFNHLNRHKFQVAQNSHGILFNPLSVCKALQDIISAKKYSADDVFFLNEYWHSWHHHSDFSSLNQEDSLALINNSIQQHHAFLKKANYVFITLGSAFAYYHVEENIYVGNNHRASANLFRKDLLSVSSIVEELKAMQENMLTLNPAIQFVYTVSPVRHIRDGVIDNNRSKARLLEAVHSLENAYYFPAYELVIDVLRDYRFYDVDMVHPNYQATQFVWEHFVKSCIAPENYSVMEQMNQIYKARHHKPKDTNSQAHKAFLQQHEAQCRTISQEFPYLNLEEELVYFGL